MGGGARSRYRRRCRLDPAARLKAALAIAAGAALLLWPAVLNGYPPLFSDTGAYLAQTVERWPVWDKPFVYGPMLAAFHWNKTLWTAAVAQALLTSWLLWLAQRAWRGHATAAAHLATAAGLAALTAAPWVTPLLLPDALTPAVVAIVLLLADRRPAWEAVALGGIGLLAIATHPSHLPLAGALAVLVALLRGWRAARGGAGAVLGAALLLVATNAALHGRASLSPFGSVFLLARLVDDGPATRTIAARCAAPTPPGWHLCDWADRLPMDSDRFLWEPDGPVWSTPAAPGGPIGLAPEAAAIVGETLRREPWTVAGLAVANGWAQLGRFRIGDALVADHLAGSVGRELALGFPAAEQARFVTGLQAGGALPASAAPFLRVHGAFVWLGALCTGWGVWRAARAGDRRRLLLLLAVPVALLVNAAVTGALSKPHDRYQARLIWLLPLVGLAAVAGSRRAGTA